LKFEKYENVGQFAEGLLELLLENEAQNNLPLSFIKDKSLDPLKSSFFSVKDEDGSVILAAARTAPFNIVLCEIGPNHASEAIKLLSDEIKSMGIILPGVLATKGTAQKFAEAYAGQGGFRLHLSMNAMQLGKAANYSPSPGHMRLLNECDMPYAPYWQRCFAEDCYLETYTLNECIDMVKSNIENGKHYIWEDGYPVSQAVHGRSTPNGAVINSVYTPPHFRGKGYASSVVAELSNTLLEKGNKFCCLFADASNPISCGIYRKIGYSDICIYDDIKFERVAKNNEVLYC
jgi:ribosomal protein S18 acetylase RimI-like enzyme